MCGIIGIFGHRNEDLGQRLYDGLLALQHRGQDAAGIVTCDGNKIYQHKGNGLVRESFAAEHLTRLTGQYGIGHVRYPTAGDSGVSEAQPFYVNSPYGIALGHNGNLINSEELVRDLFNQDMRHINTGSDSEILLNIFAHELLEQGALEPRPADIFAAVRRLHSRCHGAYSVVAMLAGSGLLAFRDPHGIRPLIYGCRESDKGKEYMFASESVALDMLGFDIVRDIRPGEAVYIDAAGREYAQVCADWAQQCSCIFEYVYFARPDSVIDKVFVHKSRTRMGGHLAQKLRAEWSGCDADVVIPVPDTSRTAALAMATRLNIPYREGFIKNRYIGRTFIMPWQQARHAHVRYKLNPLTPEFKDKNVLIVDDSIVRGTTSRQIVQMARDAGAKKVYMVSASPPVKHPNIYGIDMPNADELIAHDKSADEISKLIGADQLLYQDLDTLVQSVQYGNPELKNLDCSIFDGDYVINPGKEYLAKLADSRKDAGKDPDAKSIDLRCVS